MLFCFRSSEGKRQLWASAVDKIRANQRAAAASTIVDGPLTGTTPPPPTLSYPTLTVSSHDDKPVSSCAFFH